MTSTATPVHFVSCSFVFVVKGRWVPVEIECINLTENKKRLFTAAEGVIKIWNFSVGVVLR